MLQSLSRTGWDKYIRKQRGNFAALLAKPPAMIKKILNQLTKINAHNRSDTVVFYLLLFFWIVSIILLVINTANRIALGSNYEGNSFFSSLIIIIIISAIVQIYRKGYRNVINLLFLLGLLFCFINIILSSGPENPYGLLIMIFYIVLTAIMFSGKRFLLSVFLILISYLTMGYLQLNGLIHPDFSWKAEPSKMADILGISVLLTIIIFISWLFNREINSYISQLERSQKLLKKERDILEIRVKERTAQLKIEQADRLTQLSKFAEFGRLAQGLIHDLTNPLTALSLNLNQIKKEKDSAKIREYFNETTVAAENMKKLIESTLNYSQDKIANESFSIVQELKNTLLICGYKARQAGVELTFQDKDDIKLIGNKTRFSQLICNLVLNAIEAHEEQKNKTKDSKKEILVSFYKEKTGTTLKVTDNALGMTKEVKDNIFETFFSTKKDLGNSGIGLSMCKDIVENDFLGTIDVETKLGEGSEFIVTIPEKIRG